MMKNELHGRFCLLGIEQRYEMCQRVPVIVNGVRDRVDATHEQFSASRSSLEGIDQVHSTKPLAFIVPFPASAVSETQVPTNMGVLRNTGVKNNMRHAYETRI